jgi:hypothetical protein
MQKMIKDDGRRKANLLGAAGARRTHSHYVLHRPGRKDRVISHLFKRLSAISALYTVKMKDNGECAVSKTKDAAAAEIRLSHLKSLVGDRG